MPWVDYQVWSQLVGILQQVDIKLETLLNRENIMSQSIDNLTNAVAHETTIVASVVALINGLAAEIKAQSDNNPKVQALADQITSNSAALASAVSANTFEPSGN